MTNSDRLHGNNQPEPAGTGLFKVGWYGAIEFKELELETSYETTHAAETLPQTRLMAVFAFLTGLGFMAVDAVFASGSALRFIESARLFYLTPVTLSWIVLGFFTRIDPLLYRRLIKYTGPPVLFVFPTLAVVSNGEAALYAAEAQTQVILFITLLLRLPMSYVIPWTLISLGATFFMHRYVVSSSDDLLLQMIPVLTVGLLTLVVAYRIEYDSRIAFYTRTQYQSLIKREQSVQADRLDWLENLSRFLKHEFRNALLGVSTSLDRLEMTSDSAQPNKYLARARHSLDFMRQLLNETAEAASISAAISNTTGTKQLDVSSVVAEVVEGYQQSFSSVRLVFQTVSNEVRVEGNAERLVQLLEKLITNAIEHHTVGTPITIELQTQGSFVVLSVENIGDALDESIDELSRLFRSSKTNSNNLGLGLYVARRIAELHGGRLEAESLRSPRGARFRLILPMA